MLEERFFSPLMRDQALPPITVVIAFTSYLLLNIGCMLLMAYTLTLGIMCMAAINLLMFLFLRPRWVVPLYILIAEPSVALPLGAGGIVSRLYLGNLFFVLVVALGLVRMIGRGSPNRVPAQTFNEDREAPAVHFNAFASLRQPFRTSSLMVPLVALVLVGLSSIMYSRLQPDNAVAYSFPHSNVSLILVNSMEMIILLGLPVIVLIAPALVQTIRDVKLIMQAFIGLGVLYALGTIFAGPLGLYSQDVILGYNRPLVFGDTSSILGMLLVLFACVALGQALYASSRLASIGWWLCTLFFSIGVIMTFGRTSWIGLGLSLLGMVGFRTKNLLVLFILQALLLLLLVPGISDFFNPSKVYGVDRLHIWQDALAIWQRHPYFGIGAGNYQFFDIAYGTDVAGVAHNQFLEVMAEMGVQGLLCLVWSLIAITRCLLQRFSTATTKQGKALTLACIGYYITVLFGGFFTDSFLPSVAGAGGTYPMLWVSYSWLLLGLVVAIPRWERTATEQDMLVTTQTVKPQLWTENGQVPKGVEVGK